MTRLKYRISTAVEKNLNTGFPIPAYRLQKLHMRVEGSMEWPEWETIWTYYVKAQAQKSLKAWLAEGED